MNFRSFKVRSPRSVDAALRILLTHLDLDEREAVSLTYSRPISFEPEVNMCHFNVWLKMKTHGGSAQPGWILGQDKNNSFSETIFHAVWKSSEGKLIDVTPRSDGEKSVLFVPDHLRQIVLTQYDGEPAINTYTNARLQGGVILTPVEQMTIVLRTDFIHKHYLWPW